MMTKHSLRTAAFVAAFLLPAAAFAAGASTKNTSTTIIGSLPPFASTPSFGIAGTLPAFAATPTFNCGNCSGGGSSTITSPLGTSTTAANSVSVAFGSGATLPAFAATPAFTLSGTAGVTQSGTWNVGVTGSVAITAASLPLPSGAATSANQTNATQKTQIVDGSGSVIASTSNNLNVQCANCSGSGVSTADAATFTAGTSLFAGAGGFFQTTPTANPLTNGQQGIVQMTAQRAPFVNLRNSSGTEVGTSGAALRIDPVGTTTQPVSAAALPLPSGAATAANQATMITSLAAIDAGLPAALGQTTMAASMPVTIANNQSSISVTCASGCSGGSNASVGATGSTAPTSATLAGAIVTSGARTVTAGQQVGVPVDSTTDSVRVVVEGGQAASSAPGTAPASGNTVQIQGCGPSAISGCIPVETSAGGNVLVGLTPTVTAGAYTSGMSVGGLQTFPIFRSTGKPSALLTSFTSLGTTTAWATQTMNVYLYTQTPTSGGCTDHTAFTWNAADLGIMVPGSPFSIAMIAGNVATTPVMATQNLAQSVASSSGTVNLYACVIVTGTPTPTVGSLRYTIGAVQD